MTACSKSDQILLAIQFAVNCTCISAIQTLLDFFLYLILNINLIFVTEHNPSGKHIYVSSRECRIILALTI